MSSGEDGTERILLEMVVLLEKVTDMVSSVRLGMSMNGLE